MLARSEVVQPQYPTPPVDPAAFLPGRLKNKVLLVTGAAIGSIGGMFNESIYLTLGAAGSLPAAGLDAIIPEGGKNWRGGLVNLTMRF